MQIIIVFFLLFACRLVLFDKILTRIRFLSFLFGRIDADHVDDSQQETIRKHYLDTAIDTPHQNGLISLFRQLNHLITGQTTSIYGGGFPSILELNKSFCCPNYLANLMKTINSLVLQITYVYLMDSSSDDEDMNVLQDWMKNLRTEQFEKIRSFCSSQCSTIIEKPHHCES